MSAETDISAGAGTARAGLGLTRDDDILPRHETSDGAAPCLVHPFRLPPLVRSPPVRVEHAATRWTYMPQGQRRAKRRAPGCLRKPRQIPDRCGLAASSLTSPSGCFHRMRTIGYGSARTEARTT